MAAALGHRVVTPRPALVPVVCREPFFKRLAGLRLRNQIWTLFLVFMVLRKKVIRAF
ncbi:MAG: hypothetical protein AAB276_08965 [Pseudomonadota bacterium]